MADTTSIPPSYAINSLLNSQHAKNQTPHKTWLPNSLKNNTPTSRAPSRMSTSSSMVLWLGKLAKSLFIFLFFSYLQLQDGARESITWLCHNVTMVWWRVTDGHVTVTVTVGHMMRVTWGPWESKRIATVVKYISSREMSENSIKFSLSNSEQRDSWLNSGHRTLDADKQH